MPTATSSMTRPAACGISPEVAVSGDLEGSQLEELIHTDHFWFSWAAFYPSTAVYE